MKNKLYILDTKENRELLEDYISGNYTKRKEFLYFTLDFCESYCSDILKIIIKEQEKYNKDYETMLGYDL